ncbi:D-alanyl-D-alanine carboxypeptidase [Candidatus Wolfebacteria bacterium]|nr:D-alanyl-D-alanine carboxypeptidase [Candidatus Wolfebacteria bacterium]
MRFQAILLSLIILVSLLISGAKFPSTPSSKENVSQTAPAETSVFVKDLYSALSGRVALVGQNLTVANRNLNQNLNQNLNALSRNLTVTADKLDQNLAALKQIASANVHDFLAKASDSNPENPPSVISYPALISKAEINAEQIFPCNANQSAFVSKAILIKYLDYNFNVFELNPEKRWPIASLSKLMTVLVAIEKIDLDKEIIMTEKAVSSDGTVGDFRAGEIFKIRDLIKAMLIVSSNDAAVAVAEDFGEKEFINEMQKKAAELKMFKTTYLEPTGLSFINQSTVDDLAKLATYIYFNHPEILEISRQKETELTELKSNTSRKLFSINKFAGEPDFIGGKTGYIEEALGRNLIALFEINDKTVLTITLGADDSFKETARLKEFVQNCQK